MKKLSLNHKQCILSVILLFLFSACQPQSQEKEKEINVTEIQTEKLINEIDAHDLQILEIDKCEYIFYKKNPSTNMGFGFMAHKGNCKNDIHYYSRNKKDHN
jgi:predicted RNA-binding Zn ribbon-like protein